MEENIQDHEVFQEREEEVHQLAPANNQRPIQDQFRQIACGYGGIARPLVAANNFELKSALISTVQHNQFVGNTAEDPNVDLPVFLEICKTIKLNGVSDDAIRLSLFPFFPMG